jgi:hypothetical protein
MLRAALVALEGDRGGDLAMTQPGGLSTSRAQGRRTARGGGMGALATQERPICRPGLYPQSTACVRGRWNVRRIGRPGSCHFVVHLVPPGSPSRSGPRSPVRRKGPQSRGAFFNGRRGHLPSWSLSPKYCAFFRQMECTRN